jgi:hypothetical protein
MSYLPPPLNPLPPREGKKTFYKVIKGGNEKVIQILNLTPEVDKGDGDRGGPGQLPERFLAQAQGGLNPRRLGHRFGQLEVAVAQPGNQRREMWSEETEVIPADTVSDPHSSVDYRRRMGRELKIVFPFAHPCFIIDSLKITKYPQETPWISLPA